MTRVELPNVHDGTDALVSVVRLLSFTVAGLEGAGRRLLCLGVVRAVLHTRVLRLFSSWRFTSNVGLTSAVMNFALGKVSFKDCEKLAIPFRPAFFFVAVYLLFGDSESLEMSIGARFCGASKSPNEKIRTILLHTATGYRRGV